MPRCIRETQPRKIGYHVPRRCLRSLQHFSFRNSFLIRKKEKKKRKRKKKETREHPEHRFTDDDRNSGLTGAFPQGRAFAHEENRLAGRSPQLRLSAQWPPPQSGLLPLQLLLSLLGEADVSPALTETISVVIGLAVGRREASVGRV